MSTHLHTYRYIVRVHSTKYLLCMCRYIVQVKLPVQVALALVALALVALALELAATVMLLCARVAARATFPSTR